MKRSLKLLVVLGLGLAAIRVRPGGGGPDIPAPRGGADPDVPTTRPDVDGGTGDEGGGPRSSTPPVSVDGTKVSQIQVEIEGFATAGRASNSSADDGLVPLGSSTGGRPGMGPRGFAALRDLDEPQRTQMHSIFEALGIGEHTTPEQAADRFVDGHDEPAVRPHAEAVAGSGVFSRLHGEGWMGRFFAASRIAWEAYSLAVDGGTLTGLRGAVEGAPPSAESNAPSPHAEYGTYSPNQAPADPGPTLPKPGDAPHDRRNDRNDPDNNPELPPDPREGRRPNDGRR